MIGRGILRGGALTLAAALAVAGPTGCDDGDYDEQVVDEGRELLENGIHFNGIHFNGIHFNGIHFNGTWTGAVPGWLEFLGMYLNGVSVKNLKMNGNRIVGTVGGVYHSGKQFEGAIVDVDYIDMKEIAAYLVQFRLASSSVIITAIGTELDAFTIYYRIPGSVEVGEWQPTCPAGTLDGDKCLIATTPTGGSPFIYAGMLHYVPAQPGVCPVGWFDGANCFVAAPPSGTQAVIVGDKLMTTSVQAPTCPIGWYDGANCYVASPSPGTTAFIGGDGMLCTTPVDPSAI